MKLLMAELDLLRQKNVCPSNSENEPKNVQKMTLLKNLVIKFLSVLSIIKVYPNCYIPAKVPYLEKMWFLRYGPKCSEPIRFQDS